MSEREVMHIRDHRQNNVKYKFKTATMIEIYKNKMIRQWLVKLLLKAVRARNDSKTIEHVSPFFLRRLLNNFVFTSKSSTTPISIIESMLMFLVVITHSLFSVTLSKYPNMIIQELEPHSSLCAKMMR